MSFKLIIHNMIYIYNKNPDACCEVKVLNGGGGGGGGGITNNKNSAYLRKGQMG